MVGMLKLRDYQEQLKANIYKEWQEHKNVLAVMPTGGGKTKTFCSIAMDLAVNTDNVQPTAIMVHRKELVQQISLTLAEEEITHNIIAPRATIKGIVASHRRVLNRQYYDYSSPIAVISVDTLNSRIHKHREWANKIKYWITDEAAHLLAKNKWGKAASYFPDAKGLGVTATPQRLDKRGLGSHVDGVFDAMVEGPTTRWLIREGYLSKYKVAVPQSDYNRFLKKAGSNSDFTKAAMKQASQLSQIVGDVVENYQKFADGKQAIVFATDLDSAYEMEKAFQEAGITARFLHGLTPDQERLEGLISFRKKETQVLINVDLFDEGLDVPGIECVIMARPTMSLSKYLQMCGRGLRVLPGKEFCMIIDHVGNVDRHGLPDQPRSWTLDRIVKKRDTTNFIRICHNVECNSPYDRLLDECPWCGTPAHKVSKGEGGGRVPPERVDGDLYLIDPETLREMEVDTQLEDPAETARRVAAAAGPAAGGKALKSQRERIETQKELSEVIAKWAGIQRSWECLSDRQIHKKFYLTYGMTITQALAEPKAKMLDTMEQLNGEIGRRSTAGNTNPFTTSEMSADA